MGLYWHGTGRYNETCTALRALIPRFGDVKEKGHRLEHLRRATNVYYDLYNNGLCNRFGEVRTVLGITPRHYGVTPHSEMVNAARFAPFRAAIEVRMDEFILAAALEQGVDMVELSAHARLMRAAQHRGRRRR